MTEYEYTQEAVARRIAAEKEEEKHDCQNCMDRVGIPCLRVFRCEKMKGDNKE